MQRGSYDFFNWTTALPSVYSSHMVALCVKNTKASIFQSGTGILKSRMPVPYVVQNVMLATFLDSMVEADF